MAITQAGERIGTVGRAIETQVKPWRMVSVVEALMGMRGIDLLTASMLVASWGTSAALRIRGR